LERQVTAVFAMRAWLGLSEIAAVTFGRNL
jgi:hypothetical protein